MKIRSIINRIFSSGGGVTRITPIYNRDRTESAKYYGKYRGIVADNQDPEQRGRTRLHVPSILGKNEMTGWALPCAPYGGKPNQGMFMIPDLDASVWVEFEDGNLDMPIWSGSFWLQGDQIPPDAAKTPPTTRLLQTAAGHTLLFDDDERLEKIQLRHANDAELKFDKDGSISIQDTSGGILKLDAEMKEITLEDANGNTLIMNSSGTRIDDANGNKIRMDAGGIAVEATKIVIKGSQVHLGGEGGEPLIKGQSFLSMFASHVHTVSPVVGGPTSPPIPQGEMSTLSTTVKAM